jgi:hypothetical protein
MTSQNNSPGFYEIIQGKCDTCEYVLHIKIKIKNMIEKRETYSFPGLIKADELCMPCMGGSLTYRPDKSSYRILYGLSDVTAENKGFTFFIKVEEIDNNNKETPYLDEQFYIQYNVNKTVKSDNYQIDFTWEKPLRSKIQ